MTKSITNFESLPNELILYLYRYFHAGELCESFFNLNLRFNNLIQSIHYLTLIISKTNHQHITEYQRFSPYLHTLTIDGYLNINLILFHNIRNLVLINPIDQLLEQFDQYKFPQLEHLSIKSLEPSYRINSLYKYIFSNIFPNLKSCYNLNYETIQSIDDGWQCSPKLRILKLGYIKASILQMILSSCPNLLFLDCGIILPNDNYSKFEQHDNLKHFILRTSYNGWIKHQHLPIFQELFRSLSNLEKFSFHRRDHISILRKSLIKNSDWLSSLINCYFPNLKKFHCYFHLFRLRKGEIILDTRLKFVLHQLEKHFQNIHSKSYSARLIID